MAHDIITLEQKYYKAELILDLIKKHNQYQGILINIEKYDKKKILNNFNKYSFNFSTLISPLTPSKLGNGLIFLNTHTTKTSMSSSSCCYDSYTSSFNNESPFSSSSYIACLAVVSYRAVDTELPML